MSIKLLIYPSKRIYKDKSSTWARKAAKQALADGAERVVLKFADGRVEEIPPRAQATTDAIKQAEETLRSKASGYATTGWKSESAPLSGDPGLFRVKFKVHSYDFERARELDGIVDTGSDLSSIPEEICQELGWARWPIELVRPTRLADGSEVVLPWYTGVLQIGERILAQTVRASPEATVSATTLQAFQLKINPVKERLEEAVREASDVAPGKPVGSPYGKLYEELTQLVEILK